MERFRDLPPDLPVPEDDGAADHLRGTELRPVTLPATSGEGVNLADAAAGTLVLYVYPRTGVPGQPLPEGWDEIPGARGCTPQNCAFRDLHSELRALGATVHGLSAQSLDEQREFAVREQIPFPLLNDWELCLADDPGLPTFEAGGMRLYKRLTLIAREGTIDEVIYPVFPPGSDAAKTVALLGSS
ncbi:MAG TPA: peroxiredoxin [Solirubrobacterales bacterium]|jgi:peroxiredoxin